ncbi:MAG: hypothetical protein J6Y68_03285 [Clostridia bacterium]|nr:hypothetical protein [Clostridia bacterium]MBP5593470.1 hypothetical protein [Clostridia bacterium]MBP5648541.1 hypothetical protein [Clostridia bacterium]
MALSKKQRDLDVAKWLKSEEMGRDMCGEFDFCVCCNKKVQNPCAKAYDAYNEIAKKSEPKIVKEKPVAAKAAKKKLAESLTSTKAEKKPAAKKTKKA